MILKNDKLQVKVSHTGAELKSIEYKNKEYLWQGDPTYWKRTSPVLFPIVGRLLDNEYIYEGKTYPLTQHGFARDMDFSCIESSKTSVMYLLTENKESLEKFPFDFSLYIGYELIDNTVKVTWKVVNANNKEMYFQIGAHPAFNFLNGSIIDVNQTMNQYLLKGTPYVHDVTEAVSVKSIVVDNDTFKNDAIIYDNVDKVVLSDKEKSVVLECKNFPFIGIWSTVLNGENAPFICLEPWYGIADCVNHNKQLQEKKGMNVLQAGEVFETSYTIKVN